MTFGALAEFTASSLHVLNSYDYSLNSAARTSSQKFGARKVATSPAKTMKLAQFCPRNHERDWNYPSQFVEHLGLKAAAAGRKR